MRAGDFGEGQVLANDINVVNVAQVPRAAALASRAASDNEVGTSGGVLEEGSTEHGIMKSGDDFARIHLAKDGEGRAVLGQEDAGLAEFSLLRASIRAFVAPVVVHDALAHAEVG